MKASRNGALSATLSAFCHETAGLVTLQHQASNSLATLKSIPAWIGLHSSRGIAGSSNHGNHNSKSTCEQHPWHWLRSSTDYHNGTLQMITAMISFRSCIERMIRSWCSRQFRIASAPPSCSPVTRFTALCSREWAAPTASSVICALAIARRSAAGTRTTRSATCAQSASRSPSAATNGTCERSLYIELSSPDVNPGRFSSRRCGALMCSSCGPRRMLVPGC
jgi:hypothetical protein